MKFYDGLSFQRIVPGYVIQGGDPEEDNKGGPGYSIDEPPPPNLSYTRGVVAMAKSPAEPPGRSMMLHTLLFTGTPKMFMSCCVA